MPSNKPKLLIAARAQTAPPAMALEADRLGGQLAGQFLKYVCAGGLAFLADAACLFLLTTGLGLHALLSAPLAFMVGLSVNYLLSIRWVFTERRFTNPRVEFTLFAATGAAGLLLNELIMYVGMALLGLHYLTAKIGSAAVVLLWNFGSRKLLLFRAGGQPAPLAEDAGRTR